MAREYRVAAQAQGAELQRIYLRPGSILPQVGGSLRALTTEAAGPPLFSWHQRLRFCQCSPLLKEAMKQPVERRLTAVLATDVAGYSRLMGADEEGTHELLKAHFRQLINPKIKAHRGRIVKNTGDGMLVEFPSVVDAVRCAVEIQRAMIDRNADIPEDKHISFRIGVNLGDVIVEDRDIFGDGVNIAARLEALAEPGGICISRTVREQIRDKLSYPLEDMGQHSVKNIARPVHVYGMSAAAVALLPLAGCAEAETGRRSGSCARRANRLDSPVVVARRRGRFAHTGYPGLARTRPAQRAPGGHPTTSRQ
jgi:adenylate cyclase